MLKLQSLCCILAFAGGAVAQNPASPPRRGFGNGPGGMRILGAEAGRPGPVVTGAPYSADAVTEETQALPDGNKIHRVTTTHVSRDSQGRTRREEALNTLGGSALGSNTPAVAFINDPVAGVSHALDLNGHTATTTPMPAGLGRGPRAQRGPRPPIDSVNVKTESLGRQMISGVPADGTRTTRTIPAGQIGNAQAIQIVTESWYSPDLQLTVRSTRSDPRSGETVFQLSNLSRAEPPSTLFIVPGDFQVTQQQTRGPRMRNRNPTTVQ